MKAEKRAFYLLLVWLLVWSSCPDLFGADPEPLEGRITQINGERGTITINGTTLDASDFELSDLQVGDRVMGEFVREKGKLRLIDLEVIR